MKVPKLVRKVGVALGARTLREPIFLAMLDRALHHVECGASPVAYIDVGSNDGTEAMRVQDQYRDANIYILEPDVDNFHYLRRRFRLRGQVEIRNIGVSNYDGPGAFYRAAGRDNLHAARASDKTEEQVQVQYTTLNTFLPRVKLSRRW